MHAMQLMLRHTMRCSAFGNSPSHSSDCRPLATDCRAPAKANRSAYMPMT